MGRGARHMAEPARYRLLFPMLVAPHRESIPDTETYLGGRWLWYQALRFLFAWAALWLDATAFGLVHAAVVAALFGMTLRFDYWSNFVELLAAVVACAGGVLGIPPLWCVVLGIVLGTGRETLPFLVASGTLAGLAIGAGSIVTWGLLRKYTRTSPEWEHANSEMQYGWPQWRYNLLLLSRPPVPGAVLEWGIYLGIAALAAAHAPVLTLALLAATFYFARIDEPRTLTMLIPWAAQTLCR